MIFLVTISCLVILCILYFSSIPETFQNNTLSLKEFNEQFDASLIPLPMNLFALGIEDNSYKTHGNKTDNGQKLLNYWMNELHPSLGKQKYYILMCPFDGYMEYTKFKEGEMTDIVPTSYQPHQFIEETIEADKYPVFHEKKTIFAMCKKTNDKHTVLLPDIHYIQQKGYSETFAKIDNARVYYQNKQPLCIWRGHLDNGTNHNFFNTDGKNGLNQRKYFKKLYDDHRFPKVNFEEKKTSIEDQIKYKYILDIDGFSNTWDATVWKLYSGSVLLKTKSKWKQWYYDELKEWEHYVPIENDFSDLNDKIEWCIHNEEKCIKITENAHQFVFNRLNWERVKLDILSSISGKI
jgi:hypothetical protein